MRSLFTLSALFALFALPVSASSTWTVQDDGTMQSIRGIAGNGDALVAVGSTGNRMRSTDRGSSWTLLPNAGSAWWYDVVVAANGDFLAVGESGVHASSQDNGATWASASLGVSSTLYDIDRASSSTGYIVGVGGTALYYANGNWHTGTPNVTETLYGVQDNGDGTAWIVGGGSRLLKASNNGISWTNYGRIGTENLWSVYFESASTGWVVGENGTFKKTTDGGSNWTDVSVAGLSTQDLYDIQTFGDRMVIAGDKIVALSDDGGASWTSENFVDENVTFYAAYVADESNVWVAGSDYDVFSAVYHFEVTQDIPEEEMVVEEEEAPEAEPGNLVKLACADAAELNDPCRAVYYYASDDKRHAFPNEKIFFTWFDDFDSVVEVSAGFLSNLSLGANVTYHPGTRMVKFQSVRTVYAVEARGVLRAIASEEVASALYGADWNQQIDDISDAFYGNYDFGEPIATAEDYDVEAAQASATSLDDHFSLSF